MTKNYKIDYTTNTVTLTKKFAEAAGIVGSAAFNEMKELRALGMTIQVQKASESVKKAQKKWSYTQMERYLRNVENSAEYLADFITIREAKDYMDVWGWFKATFPNYNKTPELNSNHKIRVTPADYPVAVIKNEEVA